MGKQSWKAGNMLNPVPAVMVSVADQNHRPNIITVAWAGTVCTNPPMVSISVRPSRYSYEIIEKTGEFVINLTNEKLAKACDYCGVVSGRDVDKFKIYYSQVENLFLENKIEEVIVACPNCFNTIKKYSKSCLQGGGEPSAWQSYDVCGGSTWRNRG